MSRWTDEELFKLLDHRYRHQMPLAVASSLCPDELEGRVDVRPFNEPGE